MDTICFLSILPDEIIKYIITFIKNKVFDLSLINKYFNDNCKIILIISNFDYPNFNMITNQELHKLINLKYLDLSDNRRLDSKFFEFSDNKHIIDEEIKNLTNLTTLNLFSNINITDEGIKNLTNLTSLNLHNNFKITNNGITKLTNLTILNLCNNPMITEEGIKNLHKLTRVNVMHNRIITDERVKNLY
jgi:Leucine-rich repeat (LRR) protein